MGGLTITCKIIRPPYTKCYTARKKYSIDERGKTSIYYISKIDYNRKKERMY